MKNGGDIDDKIDDYFEEGVGVYCDVPSMEEEIIIPDEVFVDCCQYVVDCLKKEDFTEIEKNELDLAMKEIRKCNRSKKRN